MSFHKKTMLIATVLIMLFAGRRLLAADFTANVTSYAWLTDPDSVKAPRLLLGFSLPEDIAGKMVMDAKLLLPVSFTVNDSVRANFSVWPLGTAWSPEAVGWTTPWNQPGGDVADSTYMLFDTKDFSSRVLEIDILTTAMAWAEGRYPNHGLLVMLLQPDAHSFALDPPAGWPSGVVAKIQISYEE